MRGCSAKYATILDYGIAGCQVAADRASWGFWPPERPRGGPAVSLRRPTGGFASNPWFSTILAGISFPCIPLFHDI